MRMPGGRIFSTPTISSTAAAMDASSMKLRPSSQISAPGPSWYSVVSGGYMNQPPAGAMPKKSDPQTKVPPMTKLQKP
jgi:hypothetical protein